MRLLDLIAQSRDLLVVKPFAQNAPMRVSGPADFAERLVQCPLRFVIADDLTRASAELAFADGERLASCLDLMRIPATRLWVEWSDSIHQQVIWRCGTVAHTDPKAFGRQVGVLLQASPCGRSAIARTFWSAIQASGQSEAQLSPLETHIELDGKFAPAADAGRMLRGEFFSVTDCHDVGVAELLARVRFRFDEGWLKYYEQAVHSAESCQSVALECLAAVANIIPLLLAFFLLLNADGATRPVPVERGVVNRKRLARNRARLLDHVEVHASLAGRPNAQMDGSEMRLRDAAVAASASRPRAFGEAGRPCVLENSPSAR